MRPDARPTSARPGPIAETARLAARPPGTGGGGVTVSLTRYIRTYGLLHPYLWVSYVMYPPRGVAFHEPDGPSRPSSTEAAGVGPAKVKGDSG